MKKNYGFLVPFRNGSFDTSLLYTLQNKQRFLKDDGAVVQGVQKFESYEINLEKKTVKKSAQKLLKL